MYDAEYSFEHDPADAGDHFIIHISSSFTFSISIPSLLIRGFFSIVHDF